MAVTIPAGRGRVQKPEELLAELSYDPWLESPASRARNRASKMDLEGLCGIGATPRLGAGGSGGEAGFSGGTGSAGNPFAAGNGNGAGVTAAAGDGMAAKPASGAALTPSNIASTSFSSSSLLMAMLLI